MFDTPITVTGRLVADPVLRQTQQGAPMTTFRIATNSRRAKPGAPGEFEDGPTSFFNVRAFRFLGSNLAMSLRKGDPVVVTGTVEIAEFERQDGTRGTAAEITARSVGHDMTWGVTAFRKVARSAGPGHEGSVPDFRASAEAYGNAMVDAVGDVVSVDGFPASPDVDRATGEVFERTETAAEARAGRAQVESAA